MEKTVTIQKQEQQTCTEAATKKMKYKQFKFLPRLLSFYAEDKAIMPKKVLISWPLVNMLDCENIFNWPLWEGLHQGLMDGFLDVSKAL